MLTLSPFVAGKIVEPAAPTFDLINPANEEILARVVESGAEGVDAAVRAARTAFDEGPWPKMAPAERARLMWKLADAIEAHLEEFARLETLNVGKPIKDSRGREIPRAVDVLRYFAGWPTKICGETAPSPPGFQIMTVREPVGVVGAITPWNFPLILATYKVAPALACGCTVVLKPSEFSPMTVLKLAEAAVEVGIPPGVFNVVTGGPETGKALVSHPGVDKIAFTGSVEAGQDIMRACADGLKRVHLELGGKSPHIIFEDADLDAAVASAFRGIFYNAGQVCIAGSRLFVDRKVHDPFVEKLSDAARAAKVGDPFDESTAVGPICFKEQFEKVLSYIEIGKCEGARVAAGGDRPCIAKGFYVNPTIFDGVDNRMRIAQEEIFGPVLSVIPFASFDDALAQSNATRYGLAAGLWTRDPKKAIRAARALKAGIVWVNSFCQMDPASPFGGYKHSGFGRDLGKQALENYLETKTIWFATE